MTLPVAKATPVEPGCSEYQNALTIPVSAEAMEREGLPLPSVPPPSMEFDTDEMQYYSKEPFQAKFVKPSVNSIAGISFRHNRQGYVIVAKVTPGGLVDQQTALAKDMKVLKINGQEIRRHMPISIVQSIIRTAEEITIEAKATDKFIASERLSARMSQRFSLRSSIGGGITTVHLDKPSTDAELGIKLEQDDEGYLVLGQILEGSPAAQKKDLIQGMRVLSIDGCKLEKNTPVEDAMGMLNNGKDAVSITVNLLEPEKRASHQYKNIISQSRDAGTPETSTKKDGCCRNCYCDCPNTYCYDYNGQAACCDACCDCCYHCTNCNWCEIFCKTLTDGFHTLCTPCRMGADSCDVCCQSGCLLLSNGCEGCCTGLEDGCNGCGDCCNSGCEAFMGCGVGLDSCGHCLYGCCQGCGGCVCDCPTL